MKSRIGQKIISAALAILMLLPGFNLGIKKEVKAAEVGPEILITEIMPMSQNTDDAYEYVELYNNSNNNIDLKDYKFAYPNIDITVSKVIAPKGIVVLCMRSSTKLEDFNSFYSASLTSDKYMTLPFAADALNNNMKEDVVLAKDDGSVAAIASYEAIDFGVKKSVNYKYPENGYNMRKFGRNQSPSPGTIDAEQVPFGGVRVTGINFDKNTVTMEVGSTLQLNAVISPATATNKSITWSSDSTKIAEVNEKGIVTAKSQGVAVITAKAVDGGFTASCAVIVSRIPVTGISLDKSSITLDVGNAVVLTPTITPVNATNKALVWTSSNNNIASVDSNGVVIGKNKGYAFITVKTVDGNYAAVCTVTVNDTSNYVYVTGISLSKNRLTMEVGNAVMIEATIKPANATNKQVIWYSSNTYIAEVTQNGVVIANKPGEVTITAKTAENGYTENCVINVVDKIESNIKVTGVRLNKFVLIKDKGQSEVLTATVLPSNATNKNVTWSTDNSAAAVVDQYGKVTIVGGGVAVITVKTVDGNYTDRCVVVVKGYDHDDDDDDDDEDYRKVTGIRLNRTSISIYEGKTAKLNAIIMPGNAANKEVIWSSSNTKYAVVTADGKVIGKKAGSAVITVKSKDGGYTATCKVYVYKKSNHGKGKKH